MGEGVQTCGGGGGGPSTRPHPHTVAICHLAPPPRVPSVAPLLASCSSPRRFADSAPPVSSPLYTSLGLTSRITDKRVCEEAKITEKGVSVNAAQFLATAITAATLPPQLNNTTVDLPWGEGGRQHSNISTCIATSTGEAPPGTPLPASTAWPP